MITRKNSVYFQSHIRVVFLVDLTRKIVSKNLLVKFYKQNSFVKHIIPKFRGKMLPVKCNSKNFTPTFFKCSDIWWYWDWVITKKIVHFGITLAFGVENQNKRFSKTLLFSISCPISTEEK